VAAERLWQTIEKALIRERTPEPVTRASTASLMVDMQGTISEPKPDAAVTRGGAGRQAWRVSSSALRFGLVGLAGATSNFVAFNVLTREGLEPTVASSLAIVLSTAVAYVGNRAWTFRDRRSGDRRVGEAVVFVLVSLVGLVIESGSVAAAVYLFGFTSPTAENLAKFGVGLPLGTLFRYWGCARFVFPAAPEPAETPAR
jgi:putative flippase GtrA